MNYVNAHAASSPGEDIKEYQALVHCFDKNREVINHAITVFTSV